MNLINPVKGKITSMFGSRTHPFGSIKSFHNGVDIALVVGTPIVAPEDGLITEVWVHAKGGKSLAMVGDSGKRYGFAHLSVQLKKEGDLVMQGEQIARSGNTGASTGPHVHLTVKLRNQWVNPTIYFTF